MPSVEQYDWDKLRPPTPPKNTKGTKQFPTYRYIEKRKNSKHGHIKITKLPKDMHTGKAISHLKSITKEEY